jgi:WD40 repeat protein
MHKPPKRFYITGGTLPRDASSYVERAGDALLQAELRAGEFCYVLTSRQMGKSSLMVQTVTRLRQEGVVCVVIDLTAIGQNLDPERWYAGIVNRLAHQLELVEEVEGFWFSHLDVSPLLRLMRALREVVLQLETRQVVLFIDEIDAVRSLPFSADEFFAAIRSCFNLRTEDPEYQRLTFCLLGVASPSDLIRDTRTTPFNIGKRIDLTDFTLQEAQPLAQGLEFANSQALLERVLHWTGGHPYLTQRLCLAVAADAFVRSRRDVDRICGEVFFSAEAREQDDNLMFVRDRILRSELDTATLLDTYKRALSGRVVRCDEANPIASELLLAGIVRGDNGLLRPRNRIYSTVFDRAWIMSGMPGEEMRRQRAAYQKGVLRASALASVVFLTLGSLALYAFQQRNKAWKSASDAKVIAGRERRARSEADRNAADLAKALTDANFQRNLANANAGKATAALHTAVQQKVLAVKNLADARLQRGRAERANYFASMNLIQRDFEHHNDAHIMQLLEETKNSPYKGWEWGYWNYLCHRDLLTLTGHKDVVFSAAFSPDGKRVVTGSWDETAKIWDAETGREIRSLPGHKHKVSHVAYSPDGKCILTVSGDTAIIWDSDTGRELHSLTGHKAEVLGLAFSPDGNRIVTSSLDQTAKIWDAKTGREIRSLIGHTDRVNSVAFSPDGKSIVTCSGKQIEIWDTVTGEKISSLAGSGNGVDSVAFSPDNKRIESWSGDGTIRVWDAQTGKPMHEFGRGNHSVAFSSNGKYIVSGIGNDAKVWDPETGKAILTLRGHTAGVACAVFSPDGKRILTCSYDHTAKIWDARTARTQLVFSENNSAIGTLAFSHDGSHLATGSRNAFGPGERVWDAQTGRMIQKLIQKPTAWSVAFSPDGRQILTGGDKTAWVRSVETG